MRGIPSSIVATLNIEAVRSLGAKEWYRIAANTNPLSTCLSAGISQIAGNAIQGGKRRVVCPGPGDCAAASRNYRKVRAKHCLLRFNNLIAKLIRIASMDDNECSSTNRAH